MVTNSDVLSILLHVSNWQHLDERDRSLIIRIAKAQDAVAIAHERVERLGAKLEKLVVEWDEREPVPALNEIVFVNAA